MKTVARLLTTSMTYEVPPQDLTIDLTRMPTRPKSGFIMRQVRAKNDYVPAPMEAGPARFTAAPAGSGCPFAH